MTTLAKQCSERCKHSFGDELRYKQDPDLPNIANGLATLLLNANADADADADTVNTT